MVARADGVVDPLAWWQDKQVAVVVGASVVRGWVLTAASHDPTPDDGAPIGHLTIVLFIGPQPLARAYPPDVTVPVHAGGAHGRPHRVLGLWPENDLTDVRAHQGSTRSSLQQAQPGPAARQLTST